MFDILLYLYDNYFVMDLHPDAEVLSRKLSAAGFEAEDIDRALNWLAALESLATDPDQPREQGQRCYTAQELQRLEADGIGFLIYLQEAGLLPGHAREWVIDQALSLEDAEVSSEKIKWITLLAISRLYGPGDAVWLEDLVRTGVDYTPTYH